jgi:hypothetical protein
MVCDTPKHVAEVWHRCVVYVHVVGVSGETSDGVNGETADGVSGETADGVSGETSDGVSGETADKC